jgi:hypothetical protein
MSNAIENARKLVEAGVILLKGAGWTDEQIRPHLPYLAAEAVKFLAVKAAAPAAMRRINTPNTRHLFEIGVRKLRVERIQVEANTRGQAARIAAAAGYEVLDVNLVG